MNKFSIMIPTLNGGQKVKQLFSSIKRQSIQPERVLIIDSSSTDGTCDEARLCGFDVIIIPRQQFNHGGTRQWAVEQLATSETIVFMTQDAVLADDQALVALLSCFDAADVGAAYGRQLPYQQTGPLGTHARLFNYSGQSQLKSLADAPQLGIKVAFISNSFAAYRRCDLLAVGGFPTGTILSEDTYVAAKMILSGKKIAYCAEASVYHAHDYGLLAEFKRYFDIGVFHSREPWIREKFGQAEGEGIRFVRSEMNYLVHHGYYVIIPSALLRNGLKLLGYRLGLHEAMLSNRVKKILSMNREYWK